jgi:bifunctional ADP-heptose synthase (sugar kinase/adenylyltransferase)
LIWSEKEIIESKELRNIKNDKEIAILNNKIFQNLSSSSILIIRDKKGRTFININNKIINILTKNKEIYYFKEKIDIFTSIITLILSSKSNLINVYEIEFCFSRVMLGKLEIIVKKCLKRKKLSKIFIRNENFHNNSFKICSYRFLKS